MKSFVWVVLAIAMLSAGCSSEGLKRSVYSTLQNVERSRCQANTAEPCPQQEGYDEYQLRREALEQGK
jgi:hypothetical protein